MRPHRTDKAAKRRPADFGQMQMASAQKAGMVGHWLGRCPPSRQFRAGAFLRPPPFQNGVVRSVSWSAGRCFAIQLSKIKLEVPLAPRRGWGGLVSSEFRVSGSGVWVLRSQLTTSQSHTLYIVPPEVHLGKRQKRISRKPVRAKRVFHPRTPVGVKVKGDGKARSP